MRQKRYTAAALAFKPFVTLGGWLLLYSVLCPLPTPTATLGNVICRPEMLPGRREEVAEKLREITGWINLRFDAGGVLQTGVALESEKGSATARSLLNAAASGDHLLVLEDASRRDDVVFCRVVAGRWVRGAGGKPPVHLILIDFADFSHVLGDTVALLAFNVGWGVLHEIAHVVHDSDDDAAKEGEAGECEELINRMRRECGKAERAEYHFKLLPGTEASEFKTRYVRLAFEHTPSPDQSRRRYWLIWDAALVGGLRASR